MWKRALLLGVLVTVCGLLWRPSPSSEAQPVPWTPRPTVAPPPEDTPPPYVPPPVTPAPTPVPRPTATAVPRPSPTATPVSGPCLPHFWVRVTAPDGRVLTFPVDGTKAFGLDFSAQAFSPSSKEVKW